MLVGDLKKIVSEGESDRVEFKIKVNHPEKIIREVVAFANAKGGGYRGRSKGSSALTTKQIIGGQHERGDSS